MLSSVRSLLVAELMVRGFFSTGSSPLTRSSSASGRSCLISTGFRSASVVPSGLELDGQREEEDEEEALFSGSVGESEVMVKGCDLSNGVCLQTRQCFAEGTYRLRAAWACWMHRHAAVRRGWSAGACAPGTRSPSGRRRSEPRWRAAASWPA